MFKRGNKNKNKNEPQQPSTRINQVPPNSAQEQEQFAAKSQAAAAPQLPPVQMSSPLDDNPKPLPLTHPLATGQREKPQEAVPQQHDADPGPPAPVDSATVLENVRDDIKPLPPTHPLNTGEHTEPQEAVPQKQDAQPGPTTPVVGSAVTTEDTQQGKEEHMADGMKEEERGSVSSEQPETDGPIDSANAVDSDGMQLRHEFIMAC